MHLYIVYLFIHKLAQRVVSVSGRCAPQRPPRGAVRVPYHYGRAQHCHHLPQYIDQPTAKPSLEGGAETKPPREKSFISAISQIQN